MSHSLKHIDNLPFFDPSKGITVINPVSKGAGYWAGACSAFYDQDASKFYLYYRQRQPRPIRGGDCFIAEGEDGIHFRTIWHATKDDLNTQSMEKASLIKTIEGKWRLYVSYVDNTDQRWRIDVMEANHPSEFKCSERKLVLSGNLAQTEGVKDPAVYLYKGKYFLYYTYAQTVGEGSSSSSVSSLHSTGDAYNTAYIIAPSGLAVSLDGLHFDVVGPALTPNKFKVGGESCWDDFCTRITSVFRGEHGVFYAFYDGSHDVSGNYEERTGLAVGLSWDAEVFQRISVKEPILTSPNSSGSLRYVDVVQCQGKTFYYYEIAEEDGSHSLKVSSTSLQ